ncbi:MAG TPA: ABC transporter permease [Pyrinomonadaceae bacterium]|nr:ABC transporter permease [Pyrinomonadaceae bacterium]
MGSIFQDLRYGLRAFAKSPGFTAVAVVALAVGIGANATIFSFVNAMLLRPMVGVAEPERLVAVYTSDYSSGLYGASSFPDYMDFRAQSDAFEGLAAFQTAVANLAAPGDETPERARGLYVTGNFFEVLGVRPAAGRLFNDQDDAAPGANPFVVLSHAIWRGRFGADPSVVGRALSLDGRPYTVVGVAAESFKGLQLGETAQFWLPVSMLPESVLSGRGNRGFELVGRLKPGVTAGQAQAQVSGVFARLAAAYPETNLGTLERPDQPRPVAVLPQTLLGPGQREDVQALSLLLLAAVGFVLLIACANVANLLLARAASRRREIAIRLALGASRLRLVRQLVTESLVLALAGGALGLVVSLWTSDLLPSFFTGEDTSLLDLSVDGRVLGFTLGVSVVTGLLFGLAPALQSTRAGLTAGLKDEGGMMPAAGRRFGLRGLLVVAQVALSLVLLAGAGLFIRSLRNAVTFDPGFDADRLLLATLEIRGGQLSKEEGAQLYRELQERVAALPGVGGVTYTRVVPLGGGGQRRNIFIEGYQPRPNEDTELNTNVVGPDYFRTMGIPLVEGRDFGPQDTEKSPGVVVVNEELARRYFPGQSPVGKRLRTNSEGPYLEIVGVARTVKYRDLREQPLPFVYIPLAQEYQRGMTLVARTDGDPLSLAPAVSGAMAEIDRRLPLFNVRTMASYVSAGLAADRMIAVMLGLFASAALALAAVGIYGVLAYSVAQRTREIGIRLALGAQRADILRLVVGQGMALVLVGAGLGLVLALVLGRLFAGLLFGVGASDPSTLAAITLLLTAVALLACYLPARRATKVDPMEALRYE